MRRRPETSPAGAAAEPTVAARRRRGGWDSWSSLRAAAGLAGRVRRSLECEVAPATRAVYENRVRIIERGGGRSRLWEPPNDAELRFPLHAGARQYHHRDDPPRFLDWADTISLALTVMVLVAALPSASNVSLLAERLGADNGRIARIILVTTAAAFFTFSGAVALLI